MIIKSALIVIAGLSVGIGAALYVSGPGYQTGDMRINIDGWTSDLTIGSKATNPRTRAMVARRGLLALPKSEAVYFTTTKDSQGRRLSETCNYVIRGQAITHAKWWSLTVYDADSRLPMNDDGTGSLSSGAFETDQAEWRVSLSAQRPANAAWISTQNAGDFDITLRLYKPNAQALETPDLFELPIITRQSCGGET